MTAMMTETQRWLAQKVPGAAFQILSNMLNITFIGDATPDDYRQRLREAYQHRAALNEAIAALEAHVVGSTRP